MHFPLFHVALVQKIMKTLSRIQKAFSFICLMIRLWLLYFSTAFTRRMQMTDFTIHLRILILNKEWLLNSIGHLKDIHVEEKLTQFGTKLRDVFYLENMQKPINYRTSTCKKQYIC